MANLSWSWIFCHTQYILDFSADEFIDVTHERQDVDDEVVHGSADRKCFGVVLEASGTGKVNDENFFVDWIDLNFGGVLNESSFFSKLPSFVKKRGFP